MLHLLANPGYTPTSTPGLSGWGFIAGGIGMAAGILLLLIALIHMTPSTKRKIYGLLGGLVLAGSLCATVVFVANPVHDYKVFQATSASWLQTEYGATVDAEAINSLDAGGSYTLGATVNGRPEIITLAAGPHHQLLVFSSNQQSLTPVDGR